MNKRYAPLYMLLLSAVLSVGCTQSEASEEPVVPPAEPVVEVKLPSNVNEAGRIPVLMYHRVTEGSKSDYDRTPQQFREDLERLYAEGYRPISLKDFVAGRIDVPAGLSPIVITFDDGDRSQYTAEPGTTVPVKDCALEIMESFRAQHPDFNPQATFFVNGGVPFGQSDMLEEKLQYLVQRGYTIGNHTWDHEKLSKQTVEEIQRALGKNAAVLQAITGEPVTLLALPYGIRPKEAAPMAAVVSGTYEGQSYENLGICNVGWQPAFPAYIQGFDPAAIDRVRCGDDADELGDWLAKWAKNPASRYISDGDPAVVTVPAPMAEKIDQARLNGKTVRVME